MSKQHSSHSPGFWSQALKVTIILIIGVVIGVVFILLKTDPVHKPTAALPSMVDVVTAEKSQGNIIIEGMGKVEASRKFNIITEVSGKVEWVSPEFVPGGFIAKGDPVFKIEKIGYEIAIEERKAELALAEKNLLELQGQARYAKILEDERKLKTTKEASSLRLRIPHIQAANADIAAARKKIEQAMLDLDRTTFKAPFDIVITSRSAEIGNYLTKNTVVGTAIGVERFWVTVPITINKAKMLDIPGVNVKDGEGSEVRITLTDFSGNPVYRHGKVLKLLSELDTQGRMARLLVAVDDPLGKKIKGETIPLLVNAYVNLSIKGRNLGEMTVLPRKYVREDDKVYVMGKENTLEVRDIDISWSERDNVYISKGLNFGERVVINRNFVPVNGMKLHLASDHKLKPAKKDDGADTSLIISASKETGTDSAGKSKQLKTEPEGRGK